MNILTMIIMGASIIGGALIGYFGRMLFALSKKGSIELEVKEMLLKAKEEAKTIQEKALSDAEKHIKEANETIKNSQAIVKKDQEILKEKEDKNIKTEERLIKKEELLDKRQLDLDNEFLQVKEKIAEIKTIKDRADELLKSRGAELEKISNLSRDEAKKLMIQEIEKNEQDDLLVRINKLERNSEETLEDRAKKILTDVVQRLGSSVTSDILSSSVEIPSDDMKGKIIGKEGRNIKTFERITGVEVIVDDTPNSITLSSFNPVRRQIAAKTLEYLILDGRIQPAKIEEMYERAKVEINKIMKEKGEQAIYDAGVLNLDPKLVAILGRLHFRTSYGQNVLQHSVEVANIAGMLAEEIGANVSISKAGALLHDIGKALDHEVQGTHVEIGIKILQKFGVNEEIIKAMKAHHNEYPYETLESRIVQTADAISGSRPGARKDSVENYLKRLSDLESIASRMKGVEKAYALSAGREIRVFVIPEEINDLEAKNMARNIANSIESELKYPGEIKVTVIRENRVIEFAR